MRIGKRVIAAALLLAAAMALGGCASTGKVGTAQGPEIVKNTAAGVEIVDVKYYLKQWSGKKRLHVEVVIKNTSAQAQRFKAKVKLFDNGQISSSMVPLKAKKKDGKKLPPVILPGKTAKVKFPFFWEKMPSKLEINVSPI